MKVLMLTPYLPYPLLSGGQIRTYNLLKKLANKHEITLFALIKDDSERQYISELEKYCAQVRVFKRSSKPFTFKNIIKTAFSSYPFLVIRNYVKDITAEIKAVLNEQAFDLIHAETFYMMPHIPVTKIPIILVEQTIEYLGYESFAKKVRWPFIKPLLNIDINKIKQWEQHYWETCTKLIVMSEEDKDFIARTITPHKIEVVSNGVDTAWFSAKKKRLPKFPTVLSVGTFKWLPNVEAVNFLVNKVWPKILTQMPDAKLWIVGNAPTPEVYDYQKNNASIQVTGNIPDIRDAFNQAHVLVAPVFSGKGTRYKILEAMASETPIVATPTAVEGLGVEHNKHVLTSNTAEGIAQLTQELLNNQKLQTRLAHNSKVFVTTNYDWKFISQKLDRIYQELGNLKSHGKTK